MKKYQNLKLVVFIFLLTLIPTHFTFADEVLSSEDKLSTIPREEQSSKVTFGPVNENDKNDWSLFYKDGKYQVIFQLEEDASLEQTIVLSNVMKVLNSFGTEEIKNSITEEDKAILENMAANGVEKVTFKIDLNDGSVQRFITDIKTFESVISILPGDVINFEVYLKNASNHTFQYKEDSFTIATPKLEGTSSNNSTGFDGQKLPDEYQTHITKSIGLRSNGIKYLLTNAGILKGMDDNNTLMDIRSNKGLTFDEWLKVKEYLNNYFQTKGITYTNYRDALEAYLLDYYNNPENGYIKVEDKDKYSTIKDLAANNNNVSGNLYDTSNNYEFKIKVDDPSIASLILKKLNMNDSFAAIKVYIAKIYEENNADATEVMKKTSLYALKSQVGKDVKKYSGLSDLYEMLKKSSNNSVLLKNLYNYDLNNKYATSKDYAMELYFNALGLTGLTFDVKLNENTYYNNFYNNLLTIIIGSDEDIKDYHDKNNGSWSSNDGTHTVGDYMIDKINNTGVWKDTNDYLESTIGNLTNNSLVNFGLSFNLDGRLTGNDYQLSKWGWFGSLTLKQIDGDLYLRKIDEFGNTITSSETSFYIWYQSNEETFYLVKENGVYKFIKYDQSQNQDYYVTTINGVLDIKNILLETNTYYITEAIAPNGYVLNDNIYKISSNQTQDDEVIMNLVTGLSKKAIYIGQINASTPLNITITNYKVVDGNVEVIPPKTGVGEEGVRILPTLILYKKEDE